MPKKRSNQYIKSNMKRRIGSQVKKRAYPLLGMLPNQARLRKAAFAIISAIPITFLLSSVGVFRHLEMPILDAQMHLRAAPEDSDVVIVRITDADYRKIFKGKSPLDPAELQNIINAIARGRPKVIGVAVDTAPAQFQNIQPPPDGPPIIWAREAIYSNRDKKFYMADVLGGKVPPPTSGLVLLKLDKDEVVRRYTRAYKTDMGSFPSFTWALIKEYQSDTGIRLKESQDEMLIEFIEGAKPHYRFDLPASEVRDSSNEEHWSSDSIVKDKIVLLGGHYAGQDEHDTPLGWMTGVEVLAHVIETELRGGGVKPPGAGLIILLGAIAGLVLWLLLNFFSLRVSLLLSIPVIPALAFLCSLLAFRSVSQFAYFMPILMAVLGQQLYERFKESQKKRTLGNSVTQ